jgi:transcriptional regulator of NAD metabolism
MSTRSKTDASLFAEPLAKQAKKYFKALQDGIFKEVVELTLRGSLSNAKKKFSKSFWDEWSGKFVGERCSREMESVVCDLGPEQEVNAVKKMFEMRAKVMDTWISYVT